MMDDFPRLPRAWDFAMTMPMRRTGIVFVLSGVLLAGCEPDDPAVRVELTELRTELAEANKTLDEQRDELKSLRRKAAEVDFVEPEKLSGSLGRETDGLKRAVIEAFPGFRMVSASVGQVETPVTTATPYRAKFFFKLRALSAAGTPTGAELGPYSLALAADREGKWAVPTAGEIAAKFQAGGSGQGAPASERAGGAPTGGDGARTVNWGDGGAQGGGASGPSATVPAEAPSRPTANPMQAEETREIRFD